VKTTSYCLIVFSLGVLVSGCLTSEEPFYQEGDVVVDDRLVGIYRDVPNQPSQTGQSFWSIEKSIDHQGHYRVAFFSRNETSSCSMKFHGVLFQIGTNRFLDLLPTPEPCDYVPGSTPSLIEILQEITLQPLHLVVKVCPNTNSLQYAMIDEKGRQAALAKSPGIWDLKRSQGFPRLLPDTRKQREFLARFGSDTNIFKPSELRRETKQ
jgi:hypothetical protein